MVKESYVRVRWRRDLLPSYRKWSRDGLGVVLLDCRVTMVEVVMLLLEVEC